MQEFRRRSVRGLAAALLATLVAVAPAVAADDPASSTGIGAQIGRVGEMTFDVIVLRPLGLVATVGGFGCFLLAAPMLAPSWEIPYGWDTFVMGPYDYTVVRPLGDF